MVFVAVVVVVVEAGVGCGDAAVVAVAAIAVAGSADAVAVCGGQIETMAEVGIVETSIPKRGAVAFEANSTLAPL